MGVGCIPSAVSKTSSRFEAGSVLTRRTRLPPSAKNTAVAQAMDVLPTPPLPVNMRFLVGFPSDFMLHRLPILLGPPIDTSDDWPLSSARTGSGS